MAGSPDPRQEDERQDQGSHDGEVEDAEVIPNAQLDGSEEQTNRQKVHACKEHQESDTQRARLHLVGRRHRNVAMASSGLRRRRGTRAPSAGYPVTTSISGRSLAGRPRTSPRNPIGFGV